MTSKYIKSDIFRTYIGLLSKLMDLPQSALLNVNGSAKEQTVFHRMELVGYGSNDSSVRPTLSIKSYAITEMTDAPVPAGFAEINPEYEFARNAIFWAGDRTKVFKEYQALIDKKACPLSWCSNYERELTYPTFVINEAEPIFTMEIKLDMLQLLEVPSEPRTFVGAVTEDGVFIPAKPTVVAKPAPVVTKEEPVIVKPYGHPVVIEPIAFPEVSTRPAVWGNGRSFGGMMHKVIGGLSDGMVAPAYPAHTKQIPKYPSASLQ